MLSLYETTALPEEEIGILHRERPVCAWCHNPIMEAEYYGIDDEPVCRDCIEACKCVRRM